MRLYSVHQTPIHESRPRLEELIVVIGHSRPSFYGTIFSTLPAAVSIQTAPFVAGATVPRLVNSSSPLVAPALPSPAPSVTFPAAFPAPLAFPLKIEIAPELPAFELPLVSW